MRVDCGKGEECTFLCRRCKVIAGRICAYSDGLVDLRLGWDRMAIQVVMGASLRCSFGTAPSTLVVVPTSRTLAGGVPAATIMDHIPAANVMPFGLCSSLANPT